MNIHHLSIETDKKSHTKAFNLINRIQKFTSLTLIAKHTHPANVFAYFSFSSQFFFVYQLFLNTFVLLELCICVFFFSTNLMYVTSKSRSKNMRTILCYWYACLFFQSFCALKIAIVYSQVDAKYFSQAPVTFMVILIKNIWKHLNVFIIMDEINAQTKSI